MKNSNPTSEIRDGETFDIQALENYLKKVLPQYTGRLEVRQFPGGHSNLTYLVRSGDREWVLRRPPAGSKVKAAHDMEREYRILKALAPVFPFAPEPVLFGGDASVIGGRFVLMERRRGVVMRKEIPRGMAVTKEMAEKLCKNMIEVLFQMHCLDYKAIGLQDFGKPAGYIRRQVEGWSKRYQAAMTLDAPDCDAVMTWLADHIPPESGHSGLVHGDFKLDNILIDPGDPTKITGILDWEMATIGDPIADLAYALIYWPAKEDPHPLPFDTMPALLKKAATREQLLEHYQTLCRRSIEHMDFYYCLNFFRLGAILQQIYYRYDQGLTRDKRFAAMKQNVADLMRAAKRVIRNHRGL